MSLFPKLSYFLLHLFHCCQDQITFLKEMDFCDCDDNIPCCSICSCKINYKGCSVKALCFVLRLLETSLFLFVRMAQIWYTNRFIHIKLFLVFEDCFLIIFWIYKSFFSFQSQNFVTKYIHKRLTFCQNLLQLALYRL